MAAPEHHDAAARAAFERHVVPEVELLYRVARSITGDAVDAEDLVQDTMLRAYRGIGSFDGRFPRAWLLTIMRNAQVNRVRRRRPELLRDPEIGTRILESRTPEGSAEEAVMDEAFDSVVEQAFEELPPRFRRVVELVDLHGLSYQEAAEVLGVPIGTVMSRLHRARRRIRGRLESAGMGPRRTR